MDAWHYWLIAGIFLIILEIFTPGFVLASFGFGCLMASISAYFEIAMIYQICFFSVGTLIIFFGIRPLFKKFLLPEKHIEETNVKALIGKEARVIEQVNNKLNIGRVVIGGEDWRAVAEDNAIYKDGAMVVVTKVEGTKVFIKKN